MTYSNSGSVYHREKQREERDTHPNYVYLTSRNVGEDWTVFADDDEVSGGGSSMNADNKSNILPGRGQIGKTNQINNNNIASKNNEPEGGDVETTTGVVVVSDNSNTYLYFVLTLILGIILGKFML